LVSVDGISFIVLEYLSINDRIFRNISCLVFNFFVNFGIALLSPLVISVGMLFGLPLTTAIDIVFRGISATPTFLLGATFLTISFVLATFPIEQLVRHMFRAKKEAVPENVNEMKKINEVK